MDCPLRILLFGSTGSIGSAISTTFIEGGWEVVPVSRSPASGVVRNIVFDLISVHSGETDVFDKNAPYDAVCWAQGCNASDSVYTVNLDEHAAVYEANCLYVLATLKNLLNRRLLAPKARLCIISSIWQKLARQDKLSYCMSKAALQGLVLSASADLAIDGILINAILPGALDTPMTRQNVAPDQLERLSSATYFNRLPALQDVANLAFFLCSPKNTGITGQFIAADLGFSNVRLL
jgi:NAD(P)-dependent dehydrogenase (short-subunit alcohol dehydrogenase family)